MTPIQESELLLPTAEHIREAEELLFPKYASALQRGYLAEAAPVVATALASRDAKHALERAGRDAKFEAHTKAVSAFLNELLAVYDPCADTDAVIFVKDACATLLQHATTDRQSAYDRDARIGELEAALKPFASLADAYDQTVRPYSDAELIWCNHATIGQLRAARTALQPTASREGEKV